MQYDVIVIHFGELWLKGKNRGSFVRRLFDNVSTATKGIEMDRLSIERDRFVMYIKRETDIEAALTALSTIPGISYFAPAMTTKPELDEIVNGVKRLGIDYPVRIEASRSDKSHKFDSGDIVGALLKRREALHMELDKDAKRRLYINVMKDKALLFIEKMDGAHGLPVGSSGRAVVLLSGGIDSPVASFYAMKRGLEPVYLHLHTFPNNEIAVESKIPKIVSHLSRYSGRARTYYAPAHIFQAATLKVPRKYELVLFKRFIYKLAERVARAEGASTIVTGESLGQVASQTVENLRSSQSGVKSLILRPLTGFDKEEIISKAREIGTYELSIQEYRDVCSIKIRNPATRAGQKEIDELYRRCSLQKALSRTYKEARVEEMAPIP